MQALSEYTASAEPFKGPQQVSTTATSFKGSGQSALCQSLDQVFLESNASEEQIKFRKMV